MVQVSFEDFFKVPDLKFDISRLRKDLEIILDTFIYGDLHWNKNGTKIVFNSLINKIKF